MPDEPKTQASGVNPQAATNESRTQPQSTQFTLDASTLSTGYANFCHVSGLPEELVLDFGLNTQMAPSPNQPIKLTHRVVMNFHTAKRLLHALHMAVSRHESDFGPLELDFRKRMRPSSAGPRAAGE